MLQNVQKLSFMMQNNAFNVKNGSLPQACRDSLLIQRLGQLAPLNCHFYGGIYYTKLAGMFNKIQTFFEKFYHRDR